MDLNLLQRALAQMEEASSGSLAHQRGPLATVMAAARQAGELAQENARLAGENYQLRQAGPSPTTDLALRELEALFGPEADGTRGTDYPRIAVEALPGLLTRIRQADRTADLYAALLQRPQLAEAPTHD